mmetsp:Transcript_12621/g.18889  ORF Transcript_12621/g.18889 Transcript_12621/m.18889 type:complete len:567 (+) Transcript_12621:51-1751(+)
MADKMVEKLTRAMDMIGTEEGPESKDRPKNHGLAKSFQKSEEIMAFMKKGSSLPGWSDDVPEKAKPPEKKKIETVRVTGFNVVNSPQMSPLLVGRDNSKGGFALAGELGEAPKKAKSRPQTPKKSKNKKPEPGKSKPKQPKAKSSEEGKRKNQQKSKANKGTQNKKREQKGKAKSKQRHQNVSMQYDDPKRLAKFNKHAVLDRTAVDQKKRVPLFSHLPQYEGHHAVSLQVGLSKPEIHPAILRLGVKFAEGVIVGSNARCTAMLTALQEAIKDFQWNEEKEIKRQLMDMLKPIIRFVAVDCRPMSPGMGNAIRYVKNAINQLPNGKSIQDCKDILIKRIESFMYERIEVADMIIAESGASRISDGDVILTYARSKVVEMTFYKALENKKQFRVMVVDSRPKYEGKALAKRLADRGVDCTYMLLNGLSYAMKEVTKVMVGASAILANGAVVSRVGTAMVGMMANVYNIPVIVCCEIYKFHERVQVSSISFNELGDPQDLVTIDKDYKVEKDPELSSWKKVKNLKLLNLTYDLTPADFVSMVITEVGQIPVTSVPVVLREHMKYSTT